MRYVSSFGQLYVPQCEGGQSLGYPNVRCLSFEYYAERRGQCSVWKHLDYFLFRGWTSRNRKARLNVIGVHGSWACACERRENSGRSILSSYDLDISSERSRLDCFLLFLLYKSMIRCGREITAVQKRADSRFCAKHWNQLKILYLLLELNVKKVSVGQSIHLPTLSFLSTNSVMGNDLPRKCPSGKKGSLAYTWTKDA